MMKQAKHHRAPRRLKETKKIKIYKQPRRSVIEIFLQNVTFCWVLDSVWARTNKGERNEIKKNSGADEATHEQQFVPTRSSVAGAENTSCIRGWSWVKICLRATFVMYSKAHLLLLRGGFELLSPAKLLDIPPSRWEQKREEIKLSF